MIKKPPNGGIPLLENTRNAKTSASSGLVFLSSAKCERCVLLRPLVRRTNHLRNELRIYSAR